MHPNVSVTISAADADADDFDADDFAASVAASEPPQGLGDPGGDPGGDAGGDAVGDLGGDPGGDAGGDLGGDPGDTNLHFRPPAAAGHNFSLAKTVPGRPVHTFSP